MKKIFKGILIFLAAFLLYKCTQTTDPVMPTAAQTRRLLTGDVSKKWKISEAKSASGTTISCVGDLELTFISLKDSMEFTNSVANCLHNKTLDYSKFLVKLKQQDLYLQYYKYQTMEDKDPINDTIQRKILYITDKELRTLYYSALLQENVVEIFTAL